MAQTDDVVLSPNDEIFADVYQDVSPSVVSISVIARQSNTGFPDQGQTVVAGGTGFVIDAAGHIMTNNHVVEGATEIEISFFDGTLTSAEVVGLDPDSDLAVLKVDLPEDSLVGLRPAEFADSDALRIGQTVLAIGSPFGQRWTLTSGIISATGRSIRGLTDFSIGGVIQTDAAINPGNSGGPLIDLNGRVVGVNSQIMSTAQSNSGVGFAVPSNLARRVAQDLIENGFVNYSYLGIVGRDMYLPLIEAFDLPNNTQGVVVTTVSGGGPADRADLEGVVFEDVAEENDSRAVPESVDVITAINGEPLSGIGEMIAYLAAETEPGQTATLSVLRLSEGQSEELQLEVRLTPRP
jgi:S1-C subfamily serine protease